MGNRLQASETRRRNLRLVRTSDRVTQDSDLIPQLLAIRQADVTTSEQYRRAMRDSTLAVLTAPVWVPLAVIVGGLRLTIRAFRPHH